MRELIGKRYWIVGASEGLGRAVAEKLSRMGAHVVLSSRTADRLEQLAETLPGKADVVTVDVARTDSVRAAAKAAGDIDGVVYLAGVYWPQAAQDWNAGEVEEMCDINFLGAARVMGQVVPGFLERGHGHIVLTGSLAGFRGLPGAIGYCASKAGVMTLAESMHADLRGTGVDVQLVNPGYIRTRLTAKNDFSMPFLMEPEEAAADIVEHMRTDNFKRSFPEVFSWLFRLAQFLPDWAYYPLFAARR
ncbi:short-subunit dehydrogenase [Rhodovulum imhoffii]|uniref:Short-subunit dehydrogenase n=1 Tax=Rhodovulum imhoffii TaxID=365340 RepID=A0A2T5BV11_9RHOB|nr:SDR family NAD(P)-dependent oxidoreductase [Rhodovulum imhoffii]MBK5934656.1 short-chain dehydrogenase [Rhodovulum imhoffii]PTN03369.1 short-subunit dehydrogenase [Rhodovulum imhoffii]